MKSLLAELNMRYFNSANRLFCLFFANAKLVKIFRIRKKYSLRLEVKGAFSIFRYIFHAIHLLAI